ncbi:MAG: MliC family protein [Burkholderiales bacterium]|nr:MliC family protein [Burkholderiales bacterium]
MSRYGILAAAALTAGCVGTGVEESVLPERVDYACKGNRVLRVARAPDGRHAQVNLDGKPITLARAQSAAQEKFTDGAYALYLDGERAMLERDGRVLFGPCVTGPLPKAERYRE